MPWYLLIRNRKGYDMDPFDHIAQNNEVSDLYAQLATKDVQIAEMREASTKLLKAVDDLISESDGVCGLHLNGDAAPWGSLVAGGMFEEWLLPLEEARAVLAKYPVEGVGNEKRRNLAEKE